MDISSTESTEREWAALREQLRTFHITGLGLEEWIPALEGESVLAGRVPTHPPASQPPLSLLATALHAHRGPARESMLGQIRQSADRLTELLALDDSHAADTLSEESLSSSMGSGVDRFLNTAHIATALRKRANPVQRMDSERRERCRRAIALLRAATTEAAGQPQLLVFHTGSATAVPHGAELRSTPDPCGDAVNFCKRHLQNWEGALRALRVARLELEQSYNALLHDPILERFQWPAAHPEELAGAVPVVVVLRAAEFAELPLSAITRTLESGLPMQILVLDPGLTDDAIRGDAPDIAALALAHRNIVITQGSVCAPDTLANQLTAIARTVHPALAVVADTTSLPAQVLAESAALPPFTYQPAVDGTLAGGLHFDFAEPFAWTPAHAAALEPSLRKHFRLLPEEAEDNEQIELGLYLERYHERAPLAIPYLPVLDETGRTRRLAVSRDLADYCHDRMQAWRWLKDAATIPAPVPIEVPTPVAGAEDAMRRGAEQAIARAIQLLTNQEA